MKKLALSIVILFAVVWGGFKLGAWLGGYHWLQQVEAQAREYGVLKWAGVGSSLGGHLEVKQPELDLFDLSVPITSDRVTVSADQPVSLLLWLWLSPEKRPHPFEASFETVRMPLQEQMFKSWVTAEPEAADAAWNPWHLRHCGDMQRPGAQDLLAIGIDEVAADGHVALTSKAGGQQLFLELDTQALGSLELTYQSQRLPQEWAAWATWPWGEWQSVHLVLRDGGLMRRLAAYCAQRGEVSTQAWAKAEAESLARALQERGIKPSRQWLALYATWLAEGGELVIDLPATGQHDLNDLPGWLAYLNEAEPRVRYNDSNVPDLTIAFDPDRFRQQQAQAEAALTEPSEPEPAAAPTAELRETPIQSLDYWLERWVRVELDTGRVLEGRLTAVDERQLEVTQLVESGEVAYPIKVGRIKRFEVRRLPTEVAPQPPQPEDEPMPANQGGTP
ncbi:hypothetical protein QQM79_05890 [Marinobacteraceae bacterium S3BR75-40.1]